MLSGSVTRMIGAPLMAAMLGLAWGIALGSGQAPALQAHRIDDWRAVSDTEILITTNSGHRYRALLSAPCPGLRFTDRIAFVTRGERRIDRFAGIQLPDGSRCLFKALSAVSRPTGPTSPASDTAAR